MRTPVSLTFIHKTQSQRQQQHRQLQNKETKTKTTTAATTTIWRIQYSGSVDFQLKNRACN